MSRAARMHSRNAQTNPIDGCVVWSPLKSVWYWLMLTCALCFGWSTWTLQTSAISGCLTALTLSLGHSIGLHRLLIHRSFQCSKALEYVLVTIGTLVSMGGPSKMQYMHDIRDWSQRHPRCHPFFIHQSSLWKDWWWNLNCEIRLKHPPRFTPDATSSYYRFLDRYWLLLQLPWALGCYLAGGWPLVVWGQCVRVALSLTGHWFVGFLAHNYGTRSFHLDGHAVQGYNVPGLAFISMGEALHNNHHAFPESAKFGITRGQLDPGWWILCGLEKLGLVWALQTPEDQPLRKELKSIDAVC